MNPLRVFPIEVLIWVVPAIMVSLGLGATVGRILALRSENSRLAQDRAKTLKALQKLVDSTEQLTSDVGQHNTDLATVGQDVCDVSVGEAFEEVQAQLLGHIAEAIQANRRLEDDLVVTRYHLEVQAQELDRTRVEARTDQLSGVANRKAFDESLQFVISKFKRTGEEFTLVLADVDHFKRINDTHGHQSGDRVVNMLGSALRKLIRPGDFVARFGGDEFALVLDGLPSDAAEEVVKRIHSQVNRSIFDVGANGARVSVTMSMGIANAQEGDSTASVFERADQALYASKGRGRNQVQNWNPEMDDKKVPAAIPKPRPADLEVDERRVPLPT